MKIFSQDMLEYYIAQFQNKPKMADLDRNFSIKIPLIENRVGNNPVAPNLP